MENKRNIPYGVINWATLVRDEARNAFGGAALRK